MEFLPWVKFVFYKTNLPYIKTSKCDYIVVVKYTFYEVLCCMQNIKHIVECHLINGTRNRRFIFNSFFSLFLLFLYV